MRASVLTTREQDFVTASRALGESQTGLLFRRVLPNSLTPILVAGTLGIGTAVLDVAALSFLGLGADAADRGVGLDDRPRAQQRVLGAAPAAVPGHRPDAHRPGLNLFGDGLRDALDPRLNR